MKKQLLFLFIILLFYSCDRWGKYQFQVENKSDKIIYVSLRDLNNKVENKVINPGDSAIIMETRTENLGKNEKPHGIWVNNDIIKDFKKLEIKSGEKLLNTDFREAKYWNYKAENLNVGKYTLEINNK